KIWNKYKLDDDLGNDGPGILPLCNIFHLSIDNFAAKKIDICTKLLRNLKVERNRDITNDGVSEYCYYIYYWLYYNMKVHNIPVVIIDNILDESFKIIKRKNNAFLDCSSYMLKDGLREPEDLVMLRIFTNEIDVTKEILNKKCKSKICSCNEFIKPFVDSYRNINNYCPNGTITGVNMITCLAVKSFKDLYERKRSSEWKEYKLPDLSSSTDENINIEGCVSQINGKELSLDQGDQLDSYTGSTTLTERVGKIVPTTLGTIAGVSSVLALLYKVITNFYLSILKILLNDDCVMFSYYMTIILFILIYNPSSFKLVYSFRFMDKYKNTREE
ncbi:hypothetical protein PCYB_003560, partial [Plasmodium cynomolgi strain B]